MAQASAETGGAAGSSSSGVSSVGGELSTGDDEASTGPAFVGPGCGEPPPCDRGIYEGHAIIESAADLKELAGFTGVMGMLEIRASDDLVCLDTLACLEHIGLDLRVQGNNALRSTDGLANVREVGADGGETWVRSAHIIVSDNPVLEDLSGVAVSGVESLVVWRNAALVTISGFAALSSTGELVIRENPALESLTGLAGLETIRWTCGVTHNPNLCFREFVSAPCGPDYGGIPTGWVAFNDPACADELGPEGLGLTGADECDQLAESCPAGQKCVVTNGYYGGCVQPELWEQCDSSDLGCCLPYCNTQSPQCPHGLDCVSWWTEVQGDPLLPYHEHFGLCVGELP